MYYGSTEQVTLKGQNKESYLTVQLSSLAVFTDSQYVRTLFLWAEKLYLFTKSAYTLFKLYR